MNNNIFKDMSTEQIISTFRKIFGEYGGNYVSKYGNEISDLFYRFREIEENRRFEPLPDDMAREGFVAGAPESLTYLAFKAMGVEADAALSASLLMHDYTEDEMLRRITIIDMAYGPSKVSEYVFKAIPRFYLNATMEDIAEKANNSFPADYEKFMTCINALTRSDVDITKLSFDGMDLKEFVGLITDKYEEFTGKSKTVEEEETVVDHEPSTNSEHFSMNADNQDELIAELERNQALMEQIVQRNAEILAQLKGLRQGDSPRSM